MAGRKRSHPKPVSVSVRICLPHSVLLRTDTRRDDTQVDGRRAGRAREILIDVQVVGSRRARMERLDIWRYREVYVVR